MKIAFFELEEWEKNYYKSHLNSHELLFFDTALKAEVIDQVKDVEALVIFVNSRLTGEILSGFDRLKLIATMSTGFDHVDLDFCRQRHIIVTNVPTYGSTTVAEHAFALILTISRRIFESQQRIKQGIFSPEGLTGFDLYGKTLGVIGTGNIGRHVIRIANGIGMKVVAYNRTADVNLAKDLNFDYVDLDTLFSVSDIVSLHIPYNQETHHFMNEHTFSKMKKGSILINTARGGLVDTTAMIQSLDNGQLLGVGIDVIEEEPLLKEEKQLLTNRYNAEQLQCIIESHILFEHPKVVMTPHNAFNSIEALRRILVTTRKNIESFQNGIPQNVVNS